MKSPQLKIVREAAKILKRDPVAKPCKDFCWGCWGCFTSHLIKQFDSFVNDHLMSDEEIDDYFKKFDKVKKKYGEKTPK